MTVEKLTQMGPSWVKGNGWELERTSMNSILYSEDGNHRVELFCEPGWDPDHYTAIAIADMDKWQNGSIMTRTEIDRIKMNIIRAFDFLSVRIVLE